MSPQEDCAIRVIDFLMFSQKLKMELRHSWLPNGRQESVAEHCFQMALFALLAAPHLDEPVDICKSLKLVLVHDLVEAEVGDIPFFEISERKEKKLEAEAAAICNIRRSLSKSTGDEFFELWWEFEDASSSEARFARALDHLEVQLQHNLADISTWEEIEYSLVYCKMDKPCSYDSFLQTLCRIIKQQAEEKMIDAGISLKSIRKAP